MSKKPSTATLLRHAKTELKDVKELWTQTMIDRDEQRDRAQKAEKELYEWKVRFEMLLARTPHAATGDKP